MMDKNEMAEILRNLKELPGRMTALEQQITSMSSSTTKADLNLTPTPRPLEERIKALEEGEDGKEAPVAQHPSSMCFQDTCEPCKAHLSHVVQQARKGLLAELGQASRWAGLEQEAGTVVEGYQRWEKEGRPAAADNKPKEDKKDGVTIDLGGGRTVDVPPE